jgi:uncharacterized repeat protein (TIGR01451 family)
MTEGPQPADAHEPWPRLWRMVVVGLCTLILCSCRAPRQAAAPAGSPAGLPPEAFTGAPPWGPQAAPAEGTAPGPGPMASGLVIPPTPAGPWAPPGIRRPWPEDEYLRDGGDRGLPAGVARDREVRGLEPEDVIAHYQTLDGRTLVETSNPVYVYSPRFGAVRQVVGMAEDEQLLSMGRVHQPTTLTRYEESQAAARSEQRLQANREIGTKLAGAFRGTLGEGAMSSAVGPESFQDAFLPYEDFQAIRTGQLDEAEMPFLAKGVDAAVAWTRNQAVQIILDGQAAAAVVANEQLGRLYTVKTPAGHPKLRVIKVASTQFAEPGDIVDFTLRFDNVGNQPIGNVTLLDSLTTRLEYMASSAQCSLPASFSAQPNQADSLVLRWEITKPLEPGQGGIIRFRCRVR